MYLSFISTCFSRIATHYNSYHKYIFNTFPFIFFLLVQHKIYKHSRFLLPSTLIWLYQCLICLILANGEKVVLVLIIAFYRFFSFHLTTMFNFYTASVIMQNLYFFLIIKHFLQRAQLVLFHNLGFFFKFFSIVWLYAWFKMKLQCVLSNRLTLVVIDLINYVCVCCSCLHFFQNFAFIFCYCCRA